MWPCEQCDLTFKSFQTKANHVRWVHKKIAYSAEGLERIKENARQTAIKRYGVATSVTEVRTCKCGQKFTVTFSPERKTHVKKTCSRKCANARIHTEETKQKIAKSCQQVALANPETYLKGIQAMQASDRTSSKAERALAEALKPLGFKRHKQVSVDGLTFDVDIVSLDDRVWIESDGEWHFRKVHAGHDFEYTKLRDRLEEQEARNRGILLIRVNNQTTSIDQQVKFITKTISSWTGNTESVIKLGFDDER